MTENSQSVAGAPMQTPRQAVGQPHDNTQQMEHRLLRLTAQRRDDQQLHRLRQRIDSSSAPFVQDQLRLGDFVLDPQLFRCVAFSADAVPFRFQALHFNFLLLADFFRLLRYRLAKFCYFLKGRVKH